LACCLALPERLKKKQCGSHRYVQRPNHACHGNGYRLIGQSQPFFGKPVQLGSHHESNGPGKVHIPVIFRLLSRVRRQNKEPLLVKVAHSRLHGRMEPNSDPFGGPSRCVMGEVDPFLREDRVCPQYTYRITVPEDRREVVGFVHTFHEDREVRLAASQNRLDPMKALRIHSAKPLEPSLEERPSWSHR